MNKTVNINLANTLFHIDDDAYNKLRRYLESIKRSFAGTKGSEEIIADIEARIAELFLEKLENDRQVVTLREVDQVIDVMGQPEDYMVDEDIFEDGPKAHATEPRPKSKKLYRDVDQKYIGGVCAGLEHYLGLDVLWIRLIFIILAVFTSGFGLIAYLLLWILVPEAATTSQKLDMRGEPINISNIERKVKEGFDDVAEKVKNVDYEKVGDRVKSSSKTFFDTLGDIILLLFKVIGKLIGIILIVCAASTLIALFFGLFTVGVFDAVDMPGVDFHEFMVGSGAPLWVVSLLLFLAVGIPFFFLLYLGLKILVNNMKSIGNIAKFSLLGLWLISVGFLFALGMRQAVEFSNTGSVQETFEMTTVLPSDTLQILMRETDLDFRREEVAFGNMDLVYDHSDNKILVSNQVDIKLKKSPDAQVSLSIMKEADGHSTPSARERARHIQFGHGFSANQILLDDHLSTAVSQKARNQEVTATLSIPEGRLFRFDESTRRHIGRGIKNDRNYYRGDLVGHLWQMGSDGEIKCQDCPKEEEPSDKNKVRIDTDGVDIDIRDGGDTFQMKIDQDGIKVKTGEEKDN